MYGAGRFKVRLSVNSLFLVFRASLFGDQTEDYQIPSVKICKSGVSLNLLVFIGLKPPLKTTLLRGPPKGPKRVLGSKTAVFG